jgi:elongation factor P
MLGIMLNFSEIKLGKVVIFNDKPCIVTKAELRSQPRLAAVKNVILKDLITGQNYPKTFSASESIEEAALRKEKGTFLYIVADELNFMLSETFESINIPKAILADKINFLKEGLEVSIAFFNDNPITIELPVKVDYQIIETEPAIKGNSVSNITKNAIIETGQNIKVPAFIETGEIITVNTTDGLYVERAKK